MEPVKATTATIFCLAISSRSLKHLRGKRRMLFPIHGGSQASTCIASASGRQIASSSGLPFNSSLLLQLRTSGKRIGDLDLFRNCKQRQGHTTGEDIVVALVKVL